MKTDLSVKMLAALALVLLVSRASEGLSKCELKARLTAALVNNPGGNITAPAGTGNVTVHRNVTVSGNRTANSTADLALIARIVCSVERVSRFNTNMDTFVRGPRGRFGGRSGGGSRERRHRSLEKRHRGSHEEPSGDITTLFGIFQLSDQVACDSGSGHSLNICKIKCSALTDNDITDDIACLKTLLNTPNVVEPFMSVDECRNVNPSSYFTKCV